MIALAKTSEACRLPLIRRLSKLEAAFLQPHRASVALALVAMLAQSLLLLPLPWLQGWVIDRLAIAARGKPEADDGSRVWFFVAAAAIPLACLLGRMALS